MTRSKYSSISTMCGGGTALARLARHGFLHHTDKVTRESRSSVLADLPGGLSLTVIDASALTWVLQYRTLVRGALEWVAGQRRSSLVT
eukprot:6221-Eustigmatos_ZCMA.PRE.1